MGDGDGAVVLVRSMGWVGEIQLGGRTGGVGDMGRKKREGGGGGWGEGAG